MYPSWAADGNLYSPWTDGNVNGLGSNSSTGGDGNCSTCYATIRGDDPITLQVTDQNLYVSSASPYTGS